MRTIWVSFVSLVGSAVVGCTSSGGVSSGLPFPDGRANLPPAPLEKSADGAATLWATSPEALESAFREFVLAPGTTPNPDFASLRAKQGIAVRFVAPPSGWTFRRGESVGPELELAQDGFRTIITITKVSSQSIAPFFVDKVAVAGGAPVPRDLRCLKLKGDTNFVECRHVPTRRGYIHVELTVSDDPDQHRTLPQMIAHIRKHYGEYEGICQRVQELVAAE